MILNTRARRLDQIAFPVCHGHRKFSLLSDTTGRTALAIGITPQTVDLRPSSWSIACFAALSWICLTSLSP
jgi:hypothetical protein